MKRVLFITNYPSPYRVNFYDELGKYLDVTVLFADRVEQKVTRDAAWFEESRGGFRMVQLKKRILTLHGRDLCVDVTQWVRKEFDAIVVCGYSSPTAVLAMAYMRLHKIPFYMEVDGGLIRPDSRIKYLIKKFLVTLPDAWISSGRYTTKYLTHYGADESNIQYYPFSSLWEQDIPESIPTHEEKQSLRQALGIAEENVVVSVSRFIASKRLDMLIKSGASLGKDVGIYIIGGEPTDEYLQLQKELGADHVHFVGFMKKDRLAQYYRAADLFALPTQTDVWGLVINEAMAYGLPVVTTDRCVAGLELIESGKNGYIIPVDDQEALTEAIRKTLASDCSALGAAALEAIRPYTIQNMAKFSMQLPPAQTGYTSSCFLR